MSQATVADAFPSVKARCIENRGTATVTRTIRDRKAAAHYPIFQDPGRTDGRGRPKTGTARASTAVVMDAARATFTEVGYEPPSLPV
jgi:hypothetical protein